MGLGEFGLYKGFLFVVIINHPQHLPREDRTYSAILDLLKDCFNTKEGTKHFKSHLFNKASC